MFINAGYRRKSDAKQVMIIKCF